MQAIILLSLVFCGYLEEKEKRRERVGRHGGEEEKEEVKKGEDLHINE